MNYEEFLSYVRTKVQENLGEGTRVELHHITKNNAVSKDGLLILEGGKNISPTIYLNSFYSAYQLGTTMPEIITDIIQIYRKNQIDTRVEPDFYREFAQAADKVAFKLINYENNKETLKKVPHIRYLDLAAVCYYLINHQAFGRGTIQIYRAHLEMWEISEQELLENARENTLRLLPWTLQSMEELFQEFSNETLTVPGKPEFPMYILSNREKTLGASVILYDQVLQAVSERIGGSFYILPSSIHECMVVPETISCQRETLAGMVREINATQVPPEDVLSDEVYFYDRQKHLLSI
ncbi:MAG: DUF5688 family protein [Candidatus Limivivens sp.]|nr:DUF5688 family protein [Candidatus Limivivens sp.]